MIYDWEEIEKIYILISWLKQKVIMGKRIRKKLIFKCFLLLLLIKTKCKKYFFLPQFDLKIYFFANLIKFCTSYKFVTGKWIFEFIYYPLRTLIRFQKEFLAKQPSGLNWGKITSTLSLSISLKLKKTLCLTLVLQRPESFLFISHTIT